MKTKKTLSIIFQSIQGLFLLVFILSLMNFDWLDLNIIGYSVIGIFWIFTNIITWISILGDDK